MPIDRTLDPGAPSPFEKNASGTVVTVWAVPGASRSEIAGFHGDALRVRVSAPAELGKANQALAAVLASATGADVTLLAGTKSRRKKFLVQGVSPEEVARLVSGQSG